MSAMVTRGAPARPAVVRRPRAALLVLDQLRFTLRELWRARVVFIFTFLFPLTWLVVLGFLYGDDTVEGMAGVPMMQFVTPTAIAMGVTYAAFPTVAITLAEARETGVLKRVRGTPLPPWVYLTGRIGGAVVFALAAVAVMLAVGVVVYDVDVIGATTLASVVTVALAIACFASLGLAVAAVSPSATVAQAASIGGAVAVTFVSGLYSEGEQAGWADRIASVLPVKPFNDALHDQFDPTAGGNGWDLAALAVMGAWAVLGLVVAVRAFGWEPRTREHRPPAPRQARSARPGASDVTARPGAPALLLQQVRHTTVAAWRNPAWVFFAVALPVGLFSYNMANFGDSGIELRGAPYVLAYAAGMITWGAAATAFVNMPEAVAHARDEGVLKRLRGTPIQPRLYIAGRLASALWISLLTGTLIVAVGTVFFDLSVDLQHLPGAVAVLLLGTSAFAACGVALSSMLPSAKAYSATALALLLPLSFFSDVFVIIGLPGWMASVGSLLPLKPTVNLLTALLGSGVDMELGHLAVLVTWAVLGGVVAVRTFRWERNA